MNFKEFENSVHQTRKSLQVDSEVRFDLEEKIFNEIASVQTSDQKTESVQKVSLGLRLLDALTPKSLAVEHGLSFALILLLVVGSGFASLKASEKTLPGSPLYPVKVVSEKVDYLLSFTHEDRARTSMKIALKRADEFNQIINDMRDQHRDTVSAKKVSSEIQKELENIKTRIYDVKAKDPSSLVAVAREAESNLKQMSAKVLEGSLEIEQAGELQKERAILAEHMEEIDFLVLATMVDSDVQLQEVQAKIQEKIQIILDEVEGLSEDQLSIVEKEAIQSEMLLARQMLENEDPKGAIRKITAAREILKSLSEEEPAAEIVTDGEDGEVQTPSVKEGDAPEDGSAESPDNLEDIVEQEIGGDYAEPTAIEREVLEGEFEINMFE